MKVGFVGLGIMGRPQALNIRKAGYEMTVWARRSASMRPLLDAGASACASPKEVAAAADVTFVMVADTPDVEQVILGPGGIVEGAKPGSVVVDMSTISPVVTREIAKKLAAKNIEMLDAPVSGGDIGAINATLSIMVGGRPEIFSKVKPLFESMGKNIVHIGANGAGQVAKACNQIVGAVMLEAVAEGLTLARRNGADPARVREALLGGFAWSKVLEFQGRRIIERDFKPGFKARLHRKDLKIVTDTAAHLGLALPQASLVATHLNALVGMGLGDEDSAAVVKVIERAAGEIR
ncbi:MAG: 2-hydroxy-3-oxopropionate reductase [Betaproteobacteria bacterium]